MREFERFLQKYGVDERLDVVDGPDGNPTLYFKDKRLIPFSQACSSGTLMLLLLFCCFFVRGAERDASFLYIDDFDAYLHFEATEQLVSYFGSVAECQTICTTHSTSLVKNQIMRPDCVFAIRLRDAERIGRASCQTRKEGRFCLSPRVKTNRAGNADRKSFNSHSSTLTYACILPSTPKSRA